MVSMRFPGTPFVTRPVLLHAIRLVHRVSPRIAPVLAPVPHARAYVSTALLDPSGRDKEQGT
jgi:hypothetical protein